MNKLTASNEDYLETIYLLESTGEKIKSVSIAKAMNVSKPGVNKALTALINHGYVIKEAYGNVFLTDDGRKRAKEIYSYHTVIHDFLLSLGVSESVASIDCCRIEHAISDETFLKIKEYLKNIKL